MWHVNIWESRIGNLLLALAMPVMMLLAQAAPIVAHASTQSVTYQNPIAYVGLDGNVYITGLDGTSSSALTGDGYVAPQEHHYASSYYRYGGLQWSPDGSQLSFEDTIQKKL